MPKAKERVIDFTHKDMEEMTGLSRKQFDDALNRVCDLYGFDISEFKSDKYNKNSGYFFPPEVAELLALLVRNVQNHPLHRENADVEKISASDIAKFNRDFLDDIKANVHGLFAEGICCRPAHLVSFKLSLWTERFLQELASFILNICTLSESEVGSSLELFTRELDKMNYNLFRGDYIMKKAKDSNFNWMEKRIEGFEYEEDSKRSDLYKAIEVPNRGIDFIVAEMLKLQLLEADKIREECFPDYQSFACDHFPHEALREDYYGYKVAPTISRERYDNNVNILNVSQERFDRWKSIEEQIKAGSFKEPSEVSKEEARAILENNIAYTKAQLKQYEEQLAALDDRKDNAGGDLLDDMKSAYVDYCEKQRNTEEYEAMKDIINQFSGRALQELMS